MRQQACYFPDDDVPLAVDESHESYGSLIILNPTDRDVKVTLTADINLPEPSSAPLASSPSALEHPQSSECRLVMWVKPDGFI